jgi:hypothetical protein
MFLENYTVDEKMFTSDADATSSSSSSSTMIKNSQPQQSPLERIKNDLKMTNESFLTNDLKLNLIDTNKMFPSGSKVRLDSIFYCPGKWEFSDY